MSELLFGRCWPAFPIIELRSHSSNSLNREYLTKKASHHSFHGEDPVREGNDFHENKNLAEFHILGNCDRKRGWGQFNCCHFTPMQHTHTHPENQCDLTPAGFTLLKRISYNMEE